MKNDKTVLEIENLTHTFEGKSHVLNQISFSVNRGEFLGIIGPNGAGKSTLIRLITGLHSVQHGKVTIFGQQQNEYGKKQLAARIGYVPQNVDISFDFRVEDVIRMGRFPYQHGFAHSDPAGNTAVESAMSWMDLNELKHRLFSALSGGEKQRTVIASVLAQQADILCLDEPTSALDLHHQQSINRTLKRLIRAEKKTIIMVTHDVNLAAQFCNRLIMVDRGEIVADGTPDEVLKFSLIQKVYGIKVYIDVNPFTKSLYILPYDTDD